MLLFISDISKIYNDSLKFYCKYSATWTYFLSTCVYGFIDYKIILINYYYIKKNQTLRI